MCDDEDKLQKILKDFRDRLDKTIKKYHPGTVPRQGACSPTRQESPPPPQLLQFSPDRAPDPQRLAHLARVHELSRNPVPQPRTPEPEFQPNICPWDYDEFGGPGYEDPAQWEQVEMFDPCMPGAEGPDPEGQRSYYDILSEPVHEEVRFPEGPRGLEAQIYHNVRLRQGYRKNVPLYPRPYSPSMDEMFAPNYDELQRGSELACTALEEDIASENPCFQDIVTDIDDEDEDLGLLPECALDQGDDFAVQSVKRVKTPEVDALGLPRLRCQPRTQEREREERMRRQQEAARAQAQAQQEAARAQAQAQQRAAQLAAEEAAARAETARATSAPPQKSRRGCPPTTTPTPTRTPSAPSRTPRMRPASTTPQPGPSGTRPSTSRSGRGACPPPGTKTPDQIAADKRAAAAANTKARTKYQPPKLKSRPPSKPPTVPKAPRGLDKRLPERFSKDPTREIVYSSTSFSYIQQEEPPSNFDDCPQPRSIEPGAPPEMESARLDLLEEVSGIIQETRDRLNETINRFK